MVHGTARRLQDEMGSAAGAQDRNSMTDSSGSLSSGQVTLGSAGTEQPPSLTAAHSRVAACLALAYVVLFGALIARYMIAPSPPPS